MAKSLLDVKNELTCLYVESDDRLILTYQNEIKRSAMGKA